MHEPKCIHSSIYEKNIHNDWIPSFILSFFTANICVFNTDLKNKHINLSIQKLFDVANCKKCQVQILD